ncbi:hypothetical protein ACFQZT_08960 [Paenibacillus sp. GCM10027628]|uniref:hypothetical protein n=1 Tax=Paenibacillus sp. GCM10027628 TaxID=3273413 RepID=UPI0036345E4B
MSSKDLDPRIKWYESVDLPLTPALSITPPITVGTLTGLGTGLVLKRIRSNDRQELTVSVEWTPTIAPGATVTAGAATAIAAGTLTLPLTVTQSITFQIWRDVVGGTLCGQYTDSRALSVPLVLGASAAGLTAATSIPTTALAGLLATSTFEITDKAAPTGTHTYILTATATPGTLLTGGLTAAIGTVIPLLTALTISTGAVGAPVVTRVHYDGGVIDEND